MKRAVQLCFVVFICSLVPSFFATTTSAQATVVVYADALASGWSDWSWSTTRNFSNASPVHAGTASIAATYTAAWGGFYLHANSALTSSGFTAVQFWIHGGSTGNEQIAFKVIDASNGNWNNSANVTPIANTWTLITVTLASVGNPGTIAGLAWQDNSGGAQPTFYIDDISIVGVNTPPVPLALSVDASANRHAISPYIYGMNWASEALAAELNLPVDRYGGNATTRYNYLDDTFNAASDWYFENVPNANANPDQLPNGSASDKFVEQDRRTGTKTIMTLPLIGWTPKSRAWACGFSVTKYGAQQATDPYRPDCGNGNYPNGTPITGNDPLDTSIAITQTFAQNWMQHLIGNYGAAANGGVLFYNLDNEPMLWNSTHRDVHPSPTSYDELRNRTYQYAAAIKATDPTAKILGPVLWGWSAYFYSALDDATNNADRLAHNNTPFLDWYLQQMRAYEQANGARILDYLDIHFYPQNGVALSPAGDATMQALRLRSTRALWDPTYADESWINQTAEGPYVRLIPRMRDWVNNNYPGTKIALGEYNWGALDDINGALAQADILGIFGRESLDLAALWDPPTSAQPGAFAFRMYRNYDGAAKKFGDVSVRAASTDQGQLAIYAAQRSSDNALTLMMINKTTSMLTSTVSLNGFAPSGNAQVYRYDANNLIAIVRQADQAVNASGFSASFPANSITLVVIPGRLNTSMPLFLPLIKR